MLAHERRNIELTVVHRVCEIGQFDGLRFERTRHRLYRLVVGGHATETAKTTIDKATDTNAHENAKKDHQEKYQKT